MENATVRGILEQDIRYKISFDYNKQLEELEKSRKHLRFQINPENWGPKARARKSESKSL